jgi:hypothetical protein
VFKNVCDFGCGREATTQLKNGRFLCAEFVAQCPAMRAKNGAPKRGKNPFANRSHPRGMAGKVPWNRGLNWDQMYMPELGARLRAGALDRIRVAQEALAASPQREAARRERLSEIALARGLGGYERGSGRGKKGWYCGYWCDSTYELVFVVWALDHEIPFERNTHVFHYEFGDKVLRWTPDFRLPDGTFVEIKGYLSDQALAKFAFFLPSLQVLTLAELGPMLDYVRQQYGRNLAALYE